MLVRHRLITLALLGIAACSSTEPSPRAGSDAGVDGPAEAGPADASTPLDAPAEAASDAAGSCARAFAECTTFTDATSPSASRAVTFKDFDYTPKCLRVKVGQSVTFSGDFASHPIRQACGPAAVLGDGASTFAFSVAGVYGYFCLDHGSSVGQVMAGAIEVVP